MRSLRVVLCLVLVLPAAQGAAEIRFLGDADAGPAGDGLLLLEAPTGENASARPVLLAPAGDDATRFVLPNATTGDHLSGRAFAGLWLAPSVLPMHVEMTLWMDDGNGSVPIAVAGVPHGGDPPPIPEDPTALLPPDPTDPQAAAFHMVGQAYPLVMSPPVLVDLGVLRQEVPAGAVLGVSLRLADNSTAPTGLVEYDSVLTPSFVWLPWVAPPEPTASSSSSPAPSSPTSTTQPRGGITVGAPDDTPSGKDSPLALPVAFAAVLAALWVVRRRL